MFNTGIITHKNFSFQKSIFPFKRTSLNDVDKANKKECNKKNYFVKTGPAEFFKVYCIRIKEDHFHIEKDKQDSHKKILDRHWLSCIAMRFDTACKIFQLVGSISFGPDPMREANHCCNKTSSKDQLDSDR